MTLIRRAEAFCTRGGFPLAGGVFVLCAVSGGVDSMALLHLLWEKRRRGEIDLAAATYDHRLRPQSAADARFVADWCRAHDIPCTVGGGDVADFAREQGQTVEEAARTLRYAFLEQTADRLGADYIATAHTADDNAETVLLHLLRGSGLNGLGGIPPRRGRIVRPLLEATRAEIEAYAAAHHIPHREDESNGDTGYTRNYLRHAVLPLLREKNPNLARTLGRTAESLRRDGACLEQLARERAEELLTVEGDSVSVSVPALNAQPKAVALRLVQRMAEAVRSDAVLPHDRRLALLRLAEGDAPSGAVSLTAGLEGRRSYDRLTVAPRSAAPESFAPLTLRAGEEKAAPELGLTFACETAVCPETTEADTLYLRWDGETTILIRPRRAGEEIRLPHRGRKTLKKWMMEEKVPRWERDRIPVIELDGQTAAVLGMGCGEGCAARAGERALKLTVRRAGARKERKGNEHGYGT